MSIIHLKNRFTTRETEFLDQRSSQSSLLLVNSETAIERFSLELTVGEAWAKVFSPSQTEFTRIQPSGIQIGRHDSIVIEVTEEVHVPNNMYGLLVPTGSLFLGLGILIAPAKVEPGFSGKLKLRLFNTTNEKFNLKVGQKLGSVVFFPTETTIDHDTIKRERVVSDKKVSAIKRLFHWGKTNPLTWIPWIITLIGSSTASVLITTHLLRSDQSAQKPPVFEKVAPQPGNTATQPPSK